MSTPPSSIIQHRAISLRSFLDIQPWLEDPHEIQCKECSACCEPRASSSIPVTIHFEMASTGLELWLWDSSKNDLNDTFDARLSIIGSDVDGNRQLRLCFDEQNVCFRVKLDNVNEASNKPTAKTGPRVSGSTMQVELSTSFITIGVTYNATQTSSFDLVGLVQRFGGDRHGCHHEDDQNNQNNVRNEEENISNFGFNTVHDIQANLDCFISNTSSLIMPKRFPYIDGHSNGHGYENITAQGTFSGGFRDVEQGIKQTVRKSNASQIFVIEQRETSSSDVLIK